MSMDDSATIGVLFREPSRSSIPDLLAGEYHSPPWVKEVATGSDDGGGNAHCGHRFRCCW